jgi:hypothetical protein
MDVHRPSKVGRNFFPNVSTVMWPSPETFLVVTTTTEAAATLSDQHARKYGMRELPPGTERLGTAIVVTRE